MHILANSKKDILVLLLCLRECLEEVGELSREINYYYGEKPKKTIEAERTVEEEMGDIYLMILL